MKPVAVLGVPSSAGARQVGQELAPGALRAVGLTGKLEAAGLEVNDRGDLPTTRFRPDAANPKSQNLDRVTAVAARVGNAVEELARAGCFPLVVGGDCTITIGVLAGLTRVLEGLGLIYVDGDLDLNTPADTPSGIFDGMGMAHITGHGAPALSRLGPQHPLLPEERIALVGYNTHAGWIDGAELERLAHARMGAYPVEAVRGDPPGSASEIVDAMLKRATQFLLHFDVDVLDEQDFPAADVPHRGGLTLAEAAALLSGFFRSGSLAGLVVTEFNPLRDPTGFHARRLVEALALAMSQGPQALAPEGRPATPGHREPFREEKDDVSG